VAGETTPAVRGTRPTIAIAGQDDTPLSDGLVDLRIEEDVDGLFHCEATFGNWGPKDGTTTFLYFDRSKLDFGKDIQVKVGGDAIFKGRVTGIEARFPEGSPPVMAVLAEDRLQELRMTRRTRTFADVTDSAVINQIATDHGLTPNVSVSGPRHRILAQLNQSDLAFVRERARAIDAEVWIDGADLHAASHTGRSGGKVRLGWGNELRELSLLADLAEQRTNVRVTGWDVAAKDTLTATATDSVLGGELAGKDSGPSVLGSALAERKETVAHALPLTADEARARAEALLKRRARRFVSGRGTAETTAGLRAGATATLDGLGPLFSGDFYVTAVKHLFDARRGLRTDFHVERPGLGRPR
jgi:phage protein D